MKDAQMVIGVCRFYEHITELTLSAFEKSKHIIISVPGFAKLEDQIKVLKFNLVILGLGPNGEGLGVIKKIKEIAPETRIWVFSKAPEALLHKAENLHKEDNPEALLVERVFSALKGRQEFKRACKNPHVIPPTKS